MTLLQFQVTLLLHWIVLAPHFCLFSFVFMPAHVVASCLNCLCTIQSLPSDFTYHWWATSWPHQFTTKKCWYSSVVIQNKIPHAAFAGCWWKGARLHVCVFQFDWCICQLFSKCIMRRLRLWDPSIFSRIALCDPVVSSGCNDCGFQREKGRGQSSETDAERRLCFALEPLQPHFQTAQPRWWDSHGGDQELDLIWGATCFQAARTRTAHTCTHTAAMVPHNDGH